MSTLEAIILGLIQGVTEFLPVSSSGHLKLAQSILGFKHLDQFIFFDLICHLGTLLAIFCFFFSQIKGAILLQRWRMVQIAIAILPLFPLLLLMKPIKSLFSQPEYLGYFFLLTAFFLYTGIRFGREASPEQIVQKRWRNPLIIGIFQAIAILPGVSRSGTTISVARILGWSKQEAISFSFLLAIPTILGGIAIETLQLLKSSDTFSVYNIGLMQYITGFLTSFLVGYASLRLLIKVAGKDKFIYFVWYCLLIGIFSLLYF